MSKRETGAAKGVSPRIAAVDRVDWRAVAERGFPMGLRSGQAERLARLDEGRDGRLHCVRSFASLASCVRGKAPVPRFGRADRSLGRQCQSSVESGGRTGAGCANALYARRFLE